MSKDGLEDIVVGQSAIAAIDGGQGTLRYRGYSIEELAEHSNFVETAWLLWNGELPSVAELRSCQEDMARSRQLPPELLFLVQGLAMRAEPMDALRTLVSAMSATDPTLQGAAAADLELSRRRAVRLAAQMPTLVAAYARACAGKAIVAPDPELDHAANFLFMLTGERPRPQAARIFDQCLILHAEHGFNASTFAARVVASTLTDLYSAVTAAVASLKGPLHGGANTAVMQMLLEIDSEDRVDPWLQQALAKKQRIMGFGHRVYKVTDPRAKILKQLSEQAGALAGDRRWFELSRRVEDWMASHTKLVTNVDFYSASAYYSLNIAPDLFTTIFALSRVAGWTAHVLEQYANNRLIRPRAEQTGPGPRRYLASASR